MILSINMLMGRHLQICCRESFKIKIVFHLDMYECGMDMRGLIKLLSARLCQGSMTSSSPP